MCYVRNTTVQVRNIDAISHEATDLDELTIWINCRDSKSRGEVSDQLLEGREVARVGYDQTIHSFLFHRIEGLFACFWINLFATDDHSGVAAFVGCSIKLSGD